MTNISIVLVIILLYCPMLAQEEIRIEEMEEGVEVIIPDEEKRLAELRARLLNLNLATVDELLIIPGMTTKVAEKITEHARKIGFTEIEELKEIEGVTDQLYETMLEYVKVEPIEYIKPISGNLRLRFTTRQPLVKEYHLLSEKFKNPYFLYMMLNMRLIDKHKFGLISRHAGDYDSFTVPTSLGISTDYIRNYYLPSYWLDLTDLFGVDRILIGNYKLTYGQGLVFYRRPDDTESFIFTELKVTERKLEVAKTSHANRTLQGLACDKKIKLFDIPIELSIFYSNRLLDAYIVNPDGSVGSPLEGYKSAEIGSPLIDMWGTISDPLDLYSKHKLNSSLIGGRISTTFKDVFHIEKIKIGLTSFKTRYSKKINPPLNIGYHLFRGDENSVYGIDFDLKLGKATIFGEYALSNNPSQDKSEHKGNAWIFGTMTELKGLLLALKLYHYSPNYHNEYSGAHTFDYAPDMNQTGAYFEINYKYDYGRLKLSYHTAYYPWINAPFKIMTAPFRGHSIWIELRHNILRSLVFYFRQVNTLKEDKTYIYSSPIYGSIYKDLPETKYKTRLRLTYYGEKRTRFVINWDITKKEYQTMNFDTGNFYFGNELASLIYMDFRYMLSDALTLETRLTFFDDSGPSGVYISQTEPYWPYDWSTWSARFNFGIQTGMKYYIALTHKVSENTSLWIKYINVLDLEKSRIIVPTKTDDKNNIENALKRNLHEIRLQYDIYF